MAGLTRTATICEMMGDDGNARDKGSAGRWAEEHGKLFLEGRHIVEAWKAWSGY
jgi:3,4-dihydroxy 2-butanone 4-phosphate synthase